MINTRVRKITTTSVLAAVSIVLGITRLGLIPWINGLSLTIMHVPVIIGAILEGPLVGSFIGFFFGVSTIIVAAISATTPMDAAFINPLISVLPRLFIGPAAWLLYVLINKSLVKEPHPIMAGRILFESLAITAGAIVGSLVNTVLVLSALWVFKILDWPVIVAVVLSNGLIEAVVSALIVLAVVSLRKHIPWGSGKSKLSQEESATPPGNPH
jgi:uncharacterized membrane protein